MTRELKFRAWNETTHKMVDLKRVTLLATQIPGLFIPYQYTVMQFTGTKDADGKDIYEGDIVRHIYREMDDLAIVCYDNEEALYYLEELNDSGWVDAWHDTRRWYRLAIVGNPYENPELVK